MVTIDTDNGWYSVNGNQNGAELRWYEGSVRESTENEPAAMVEFDFRHSRAADLIRHLERTHRKSKQSKSPEGDYPITVTLKAGGIPKPLPLNTAPALAMPMLDHRGVSTRNA